MFEVELYRTKHILIFRLPKLEDFYIWKTVQCTTRDEAFGYVKGDNSVSEGIDAPYSPIKVYKVDDTARELVWSQGWDDCYGNTVAV